MPYLAGAGLALGVVGLISNFVGSKKAAKAAKEQGTEEARLEGLVTDEKLRQLRIDERTVYGQTVAGYAAGGVQAVAPALEEQSFNRLLGTKNSVAPQSGSPQVILDEQAKTFQSERDITATVGASKVAQSLQHGKNVAQAYKWGGYSNAASGISNILSNYHAMTT
jgi:hypothetical protein